jgi:hypothetical protein
MAAINTTIVSMVLNATLPVATAAKPSPASSTTLGLSTTAAMQINLTSNTNATGAGTEITNANGYTTHGKAFTSITGVTSSSGGSAVTTLPGTGDSATFLWLASGAGLTIFGLNIIDSSFVQAWFGNFNGAPITVAAGNSFQIATNALNISLT